MAYNKEQLTKLAALEALATRMKGENDKTNQSVTALSQRVDDLVTAGGEPNVITEVKVNGTALEIADKAVDITVPTKASELTNDARYQTEEQVEAAINTKVSSTYKAGGSVTFAALPELAEANRGLVVNVTDKFTTTADFVEGAGGKHPAGTNVAVVQVGEAYKYDVLAGFVDLSGLVEKQDGKDLSSNDYTDEEKAKLAGLNVASDAEVAEMLNSVFGPEETQA